MWFTEKNEDGATSLTALAEFGGDRVRRSLNLERAYLQGRFGGLPNLKDSSLSEVQLRNDDLHDVVVVFCEGSESVTCRP